MTNLDILYLDKDMNMHGFRGIDGKYYIAPHQITLVNIRVNDKIYEPKKKVIVRTGTKITKKFLMINFPGYK